MFDTFDHPDMNVTAGARNVSTVPTQALTLLNNPFVLSQAQVLGGSRRHASAAIRSAGRRWPTGSRWRRPATDAEARIGVDLIEKQSLEAFTHVVLNLDEFIYMR